MASITCAFCWQPMAYVHGHAACVQSRCPMFGVNQAECCDGETAAAPAPTSHVRGGPQPTSPGAAPEPGPSTRTG
ncbi:MAG: hypothetical protein KF718_21360 [Polyangiaceae bacterium]|nr:hypothetical protein [Polyangiaceae bacterium]